MRTTSEIVSRAHAASKRDPLGFEWHEYLRAIPLREAEKLRGSLLKPDADLSEWSPDLGTDDAIRKCCIDYMEFAWEKANGFRGLSASRSISHYRAWLWMLGEDQFDDMENEYEHYGKGLLVRICEFLGLDSSKWDDGVRLNSEP